MELFLIRETSIEAYRTILANGLLSKRKWEIYDCVFGNGPITCRQSIRILAPNNVTIAYGSYSTRFSELERLGVIKLVGRMIDPDTNMRVMVWDVTNGLPKKLIKHETTNDKLRAIIKENKELKELVEYCKRHHYPKSQGELF